MRELSAISYQLSAITHYALRFTFHVSRFTLPASDPMPTITATTIVSATPEEAFSFVADYRNIVRLQPHFTSARLASEEEYGVGAEVELAGHFHGIPIKARNRIIAYAPPTRHVSISEGQVVSRSTWEFEQLAADPPSTRVTLTLDYKMADGLGGLLASMLWPIFNREIQGMTNESMRRLEEFLGSSPDSLS
jgi:ribosome-associated toxin RatA of RatAB toxin-antitoxin module